MASPEIEQLHQQCIQALKNLIVEANRTCSLLESMTNFPVTSEVWLRAVDQRVSENQAQARYQEAREDLFDAIRPLREP